MVMDKNQARFFEDEAGMHLVFERMPHIAMIMSLAKLLQRPYQQVEQALKDNTLIFDPKLFPAVKLCVIERRDLFAVTDPYEEQRKKEYQEKYGPPLRGDRQSQVETATARREQLIDQWLSYMETLADQEERQGAQAQLDWYRNVSDVSTWLTLKARSPEILLGIRNLRNEKRRANAEQLWQQFSQAEHNATPGDIEKQQAEALLSIDSIEECKRQFSALNYQQQHALHRYVLTRCESLGFPYHYGWNTDLAFPDPTAEQRRYLAAASWIGFCLEDERKRLASLFPDG